jgi:predicted nucleic acid-binding protein
VGLMNDVGAGPVALDSAVFIYYIEAHPVYLPVVDPLFDAADREDLRLVTSSITLLEVLVVPYRAGNLALANRYEAVLTQSRGVVVREIDHPQLRMAAQLRSVTAMRTPDSLQVAAALAEGCTAVVTNDRRLRTLPGLSILQLDDYI